MDLLTLVLIIICIVAYCLRSKSDDDKTVPRKPGIPFFGYLLGDSSEYCHILVEDVELGSVYTSDIGFTTFTRLNTPKAMEEIFEERGNIVCELGLVEEVAERIGLFYSDDSVLENHRHFLNSFLHDFEVERPIIKDVVKEEITAMADSLVLNQGAPVYSRKVFKSMTKDVMARVIFGEDNISDFEELLDFTKHVSHISKLVGFDYFLQLCPWLLQVPFLKSIFKTFSSVSCHMDHANAFITRQIKSQVSQLKAGDLQSASNICDALLMEKLLQNRNNPNYSCIDDEAIKTTIIELFVRGSEVSAEILTWTTFLLAINPEIQKTVQKEIDSTIGAEKFPTMDYEEKLPFTRAVVAEVLRFSTVLPLGFAYRTIKDTKICGHEIPTDSLLQCNVSGIHYSSDKWKKPRAFQPQHFLTPDGRYRESKHLMPFAFRRDSVAESLIRREIFLSTVALMQRFSVRLYPPDDDIREIIVGEMGIMHTAGPHMIQFERRYFES